MRNVNFRLRFVWSRERIRVACQSAGDAKRVRAPFRPMRLIHRSIPNPSGARGNHAAEQSWVGRGARSSSRWQRRPTGRFTIEQTTIVVVLPALRLRKLCPPTQGGCVRGENCASTKQCLYRLDRAPTGIFGFDDLSGGGLPAARPKFICGGPGSGKTLFALSFLYYGATKYGEPGVLVGFEERPEELIKNAASLNFRLDELINEKKFAIDHVRIDRTEIEETGGYDLCASRRRNRTQ